MYTYYIFVSVFVCLESLSLSINIKKERVKTRQDIRLLGAFGYIVENLHSGNFLHSVGTMWTYVNTLWQITVTEW